MIIWSHKYADGSKLLAYVAEDGELCVEEVTSFGHTTFVTYLPQGAVEELMKFLSIKGFS